MKKLLLSFILCFFFICGYSQTITSTSSKEDVFAWLKQTAQIKKTITANITEVLIDLATDYTYSKYIDKYKHIDWGSFDSVSIYTEIETDNLYSFRFSKPLLHIITEIEKNDGSIKDYSEEEDQSFHIYIPKSEGNYQSNLHLAGSRLKTLAKIDPAFKATPIASVKKPIEGTPTYTDAIKFIKSYFRNEKAAFKTWTYAPYISGVSGSGGLASKGYKVNYINFYGQKMFIGYDIEEENFLHKTKSTSTENRVIDLSNIEKIDLGIFGYVHPEIKNPTDVVYMTFIKKGEASSKTIDLPFATVDAGMSPESKKETQIYKAFNHLRKLFGAPNPIEF